MRKSEATFTRLLGLRLMCYVFAIATLSSSLLMLFPPASTSAVPPASGKTVISYDTPLNEIECKATLMPANTEYGWLPVPEYSGELPPLNSGENYDPSSLGKDPDYKATAIASNKFDYRDPSKNTTAMITINMIGIDGNNNDECSKSLQFIQSTGSDKKIFYGLWFSVSDYGTAAQIYDYQELIKATLNPTTKIISFKSINYVHVGTGDRISSAALRAFDLKVDGDTVLPGAGDTTTGPCESASSHAQYESCIDAFYAHFVDFATISYKGEIYTLEKWGGEPSLTYYLSASPQNADRVTYNINKPTQRPNFKLNAQDNDKGFDLIADGDVDATTKITQIFHTLERLNSRDPKLGSNGTATLKFTDYDYNGNPGVSPDGTSANDAPTSVSHIENLAIVAAYYPKTNTVRTLVTLGGTNEQRFIGRYPLDTATPPNPLRYVTGNIEGCTVNGTNFIFGTSPASAPVNSVQPAEWHYLDGNCQQPSPDGVANIRIRVLAGDPPAIPVPSADGSPPPVIDLNCDWSINPLTWLMCPMIELASSLINTLDTEIRNQLTIPIADNLETGVKSAFTTGGSDHATGNALYLAWSSMRTIALSLLVIIALVMVISQALSVGPFDAYTVKKVLPRIVVAVIAITLSWQIAKILIGFSNDLGQGISTIINAPFTDTNAGLKMPTISTGGSSLGAVSLLVALKGGLDIFGLLSFALVGVVSVIIAFGVIAFRNILVITLVILAPVAIISWILPNTQKAWKFWKDNFSAVLLAFPIIVAFITAGRVFAIITENSGGSAGIFKSIIIFIAYFGPYFALPMAFRLAGGAIASIGGMANDRSKGFFDKRRKFRGDRKKSRSEARRERFKGGNTFRAAPEGSLRSKFNKGSVYATNLKKAGLRPSQMRANMSSALATHEHDEATKFMKENHDFQSFSADDDKLKAGVMGETFDQVKDALTKIDAENVAKGGSARFGNAATLDTAAAEIMRAKKATNGEVFKKAAVRAMAPTGTAFKDAGDMMKFINEAYGSDRSGAGKALAEMRSASMSAGRADLGGAGYGVTAGALQSTYEAGNSAASIQAATADIVKDVYNTQGANVISHPSMKKSSVENLVPEIQKRLTDAYLLGDEEYTRELARTANLYDTMSASSPQNADVLRKSLMTFNPGAATGRVVGGGLGPANPLMPNGNDRTIQQEIEYERGNPKFQEVRRELTAQQQAAGQTGGGQQNTIGLNTGVGGGTGTTI